MNEVDYSGILPVSPFDNAVEWKEGDTLFIVADHGDYFYLDWFEFYNGEFHDRDKNEVNQEQIESYISDLRKRSPKVSWKQEKKK